MISAQRLKKLGFVQDIDCTDDREVWNHSANQLKLSRYYVPNKYKARSTGVPAVRYVEIEAQLFLTQEPTVKVFEAASEHILPYIESIMPIVSRRLRSHAV